MTIQEVDTLHANMRVALTSLVQGMEELMRASEVHGARGGQAAITALKHVDSGGGLTDEQLEFNEYIDGILADFVSVAPIVTALSTGLFAAGSAEREALMNLRNDV